ncbi:diguanylate cyclase [Tumebacillus lipolyticus]|uniref:Diguanylate cyclase n=1 Tax=Tumebacillus lipolyticus TaxID=1280370 RepID=A0ABW4ZT70_9BACL
MVRVQDVFSAEGGSYVAYEWQEGEQPLLTYTKGKPLPVVLDVLRELCIAIASLHKRTMWHGGIAPEYVLVQPDGSVRLLTMLTDLPLSLYNACGTHDALQFFAPETMTMSPLDARTDLYNLGVLFYLVLTGRFPFDEEGDGTIFPPSKYNEHLPPHLDRLVLKMINRKPSKRFQWIGQIIDELTRTLGRHDSICHADEQTFGSQHLFSAEFTGREDEVRALSDYYEGLIIGSSQSLLITGQLGVGRKRLIYEVSGRYMHNLSVLSATVRETPFGAVEVLVMKLFMLCFAVPKLDRLGRMYVNRLSSVLPRVAFEYRDMLTAESVAEAKVQERENLLFEFFTEILDAYGEPMVFELYDAHLLDGESIQFFKRLLAQEHLTIGFVGVAQAQSQALQTLFQEQLHLEPLPLGQMREAVLSRFGSADFLSDELIQWLNYHSRGSLEQVFQLIEYLADTKQIYQERYVWRMVPDQVDKFEIPHSMESLILYRLQALPPDAKEVCQVLSLFKGSIVVEAAARAVGFEKTQDLLPVLHQLEEQGLIWQMHNLYGFTSNNIKDHIVRTIPSDRRQEMHRTLAKRLLEVGSTSYIEVAHHFEAGQEWEQAIYLNIIGGRRWYQRGLFAEADTQIKKAIELYDRLPHRECPNALYAFRAKILRLLGLLDDATNVITDLYERTGSVHVLLTLMLLYVNIGNFQGIEPFIPLLREQIGKEELSEQDRLYTMVVVGIYENEALGDYEAIRAMVRYQQENGHRLREAIKTRHYISWLYNLQLLLMYVPGISWEERSCYLHEAASLAEHTNNRQLLISIYNSMASGFQETDPLRAKDYYLEAANLAADLGNRMLEGMAYVNLVETYRLLGDMYHSQRYIEKAREICRAVFPDDETSLLRNEIEHFLFIEEYEQADRVIDTLARVSKKQGQKKMRAFAFIYRFRTALALGKFNRCARMWPIVERICELRGFTCEHQLLRARYYVITERQEQVIEEFSKLILEQDVPTEVRIKRYLLLVIAFMKTNRSEEGLQVALMVQKLIHNTGYIGYLPLAHFYLGRLHQQVQQFVEANLNYKRALMGFRKLNQQSRLGHVDYLMRQTNRELVEQAELIIDNMRQDVVRTSPELGETIDSGVEELSAWSGKMVDERQELIDTLTDNEILLDAVRRVSSSIMVKTVCENLAAVIFENLLFDNIHLWVKLGAERIERIHLNEQLQMVLSANLEVEEMWAKVLESEQPTERESRSSYLYGMPVFAHDQQVIAVMVLEKLSLQTPFSLRDKRFINSLAQLVSSNVENAIMYEVMITDNLTGLYQRNYFMKRLSEEFIKVKRYGVDLSFLMIDLDNFSSINNRFGHNEGDRVLRMVAKTLQRSVRNVDIVGRFGGEELIVILPNTNGAAARIVAERVLNNLRNIPIEGDRYQITASIGVASFDMDQPVDALDLFEKADQAETFAKRIGKDRVVCHWELPVEEEQS